MKLLDIKTWRDPLRHLRHEVYQVFDPYNFQRIVGYETGCRMKLSVDDLNASNLSFEEPSCLACIVAVPRTTMIPAKE